MKLERNYLPTVVSILEISDRIKKVEPRKDIPKDREDIPTAISILKKEERM